MIVVKQAINPCFPANCACVTSTFIYVFEQLRALQDEICMPNNIDGVHTFVKKQLCSISNTDGASLSFLFYLVSTQLEIVRDVTVLNMQCLQADQDPPKGFPCHNLLLLLYYKWQHLRIQSKQNFYHPTYLYQICCRYGPLGLCVAQYVLYTLPLLGRAGTGPEGLSFSMASTLC